MTHKVPMTTNLPYASLGSAVVLIIVGATVVISGNGGENGGAILIGLVVTTIPSLIAAAFAERNAKDIRNGTLTDKARQGAHAAIVDAGVITREGPAVQAALTASAASTAALTALLRKVGPELEHNTEVTEAVADKIGAQHNGRDREDDETEGTEGTGG